MDFRKSLGVAALASLLVGSAQVGNIAKGGKTFN